MFKIYFVIYTSQSQLASLLSPRLPLTIPQNSSQNLSARALGDHIEELDAAP
jgi:hypothetical protein